MHQRGALLAKEMMLMIGGNVQTVVTMLAVG